MGMSVEQHKHLQDLQRRANGGDPDACAKIGHMYVVGNHPLGIDQDRKQAAQYYERGARTGDLPCIFGLAGTYLPDNPDKAIEQLEICAQRKYIWAIAVLGDFYLRGRHVSRDVHKAFLYLQEYTSLCRPDTVGQNKFKVRWDLVLYPLCLFLGIGCEKDERRARAVLTELADLGNLSARDILRTGKLNDWMAAKRFNVDTKAHGPLALFEVNKAARANKPRVHKPQHEIINKEHLSPFLQQSLIPDEVILMRGNFPLIYTIDTFLRLFLFLLAGWWASQQVILNAQALYERLPYQAYSWLYQNPQLPFYILGTYGIFIFLSRMINHLTTEIVLTDRRFIYKHGLLSVEMVQMNFWQIEHSDVTQSILGNLLDYGFVHLQGSGIQSHKGPANKGILTLPLISHPFLFARLIEDNRQLPFKNRAKGEIPTPLIWAYNGQAGR